jgi:hypothetical protein
MKEKEQPKVIIQVSTSETVGVTAVVPINIASIKGELRSGKLVGLNKFY